MSYLGYEVTLLLLAQRGKFTTKFHGEAPNLSQWMAVDLFTFATNSYWLLTSTVLPICLFRSVYYVTHIPSLPDSDTYPGAGNTGP